MKKTIFNITIKKDNQIVGSLLRADMTVGSSPFVVSKQAAKNQEADIFGNTHKEIELDNITLSDKLERGDIIDFQGYVECDGMNYVITSTGVVQSVKSYDGQTYNVVLKLNKIEKRVYSELVNYVTITCKQDGVVIAPFKKDIEVKPNGYSIKYSVESFGEGIALKNGENKVYIPYGYNISNADSNDISTNTNYITNVDLSHADTSKWRSTDKLGLGLTNNSIKGAEYIDSSSSVYMGNMQGSYWDITGVSTQCKNNLENLDISNAEIFNNNFYSFSNNNITSLDLSKWDTSNVTYMSTMFDSSKFTDLNLSGWNTSKVTEMKDMFSSTKNLKKLDLSTWNVSNVTNMQNMFKYSSIKELNLSNWDMSKVINTTNMFMSTNFDKVIVKNCNQTTIDKLKTVLPSNLIYKDGVFTKQ